MLLTVGQSIVLGPSLASKASVQTAAAMQRGAQHESRKAVHPDLVILIALAPRSMVPLVQKPQQAKSLLYRCVSILTSYCTARFVIILC